MQVPSWEINFQLNLEDLMKLSAEDNASRKITRYHVVTGPCIVSAFLAVIFDTQPYVNEY